MVFVNLLEHSKLSVNLDLFISNRFEDIYDFFTFQRYEDLKERRDEFERYILFNINSIRELDMSKDTNVAFVVLLLNVCEQLCCFTQFSQLYAIIQKSEFLIGHRLRAVSLYMKDVTTATGYLNIYDDLVENLDLALDEEDNAEKVVSTLVNYYAHVVNNFGEFNTKIVQSLNDKIRIDIAKAHSLVFKNDFVKEIIKIPIIPFKNAFDEIQRLLDIHLGRKAFKEEEIGEGVAIEKDTEYSNLLNDVAKDFMLIRAVSCGQYNNSDNVFRSLGRGVQVIDEEQQLYAYMHSYGKMHFEKLYRAFGGLPDNLFEEQINIVDWGCGQGLATMVYYEFINDNNLNQKIKTVSLFEPSILALKRAALHTRFFDSNVRINTKNVLLDSIEDNHHLKTSGINVHFFSNILDIELFSLNHLLSQINKNYKGINYFVIVSPYITDMKRTRIDNFVRYFEENKNYNGFRLYSNENQKKGEWIGNWTRVQRIFSVNIK